MNFRTYKLKDIGEVITGNTPSKSNSEFYDSKDVMFIKPDDLYIDRITMLNESKEYLSNKGAEHARILPQGSVLVTCIGIIGKVGILKQEMAAFNQQINAIVPNKNIVNEKYLAYKIWNDRKKLQRIANAPVVPIINKRQFSDFQIEIPPIDYQLKVVDVLDKAQELIDKRKAQIEALDQLTQSVFLEMFGDPVKNSLGFKTEPLHELCVHIFGGGTPSKSNPEYYIGNIPWVTPKDMKDIVINDSIDHINEDAIANSSAKLIPPNSLLMVIRSGILKKKLPIAINTREVTVNQDMKAFVVDKNKITVEYLLYFFEFYQKVLLNRVRSVTADNLDFQQIKEILVPVPPINKQKEFSNIFYKVLAEKNKCLQQLNELENNFNSLMQRAFKGELFND
ncbi:restriction endonuclease subunit S [Geobacillus sp. E263]|uniref:restriction endonuclease subunit S n=1 Tax=Geobacillus sp. E263 TaxID=391290 RepID=UPI00117B797D|nr:restriction endonuclease subunit S [Geobacillus sp. E263]